MTEFARRKADQLSGGQQQRVALARALVLRPRVLLLDEPLGALDAQLRKNLQVELKALQAELGITFIFVTHDQSEALTMSDRIAVMNSGRVEQAASPKAIYEEPETVFVADFLGVSNLLSADGGRTGRRGLHRPGRRPHAARPAGRDRRARRGEGDDPARAHRDRAARQQRRGAHARHGRAVGLGGERSVFLGGAYEVHVRVLGGELLRAMVPNDGGVSAASLEPGAAVSLHLPPDALRVLRTSEPAEEAEEEQADATTAAAPPTP